MLRAVSVATLLAWSLTGVFSYQKAQHEAEELMDGHLAQTARLLLALVRDNEDHLSDLANRLATVRGTRENIYEPPLEFQIGRDDGTVLLRSTDAPSLPVLGIAGHSDIERETESWRVLNMVSADGSYRVQVAQSIALRDQAALEIAWQTAYPVVIVLPLLLLMIYFSVRSVLRPLDALAEDVAARTPDTLSPLPERNVPQEVTPLVAALNRLFVRLGATLENERRFTADAAHELRTPLAALKVQTQVARLSNDPQMRGHALQQIESGVDRATHLVNQLLRLARLDPLSSLENRQAFDLHTVVNDALAAIRGANPDITQTIVNELPERPLLSEGDPDLLVIAVRNLIDNAIRYSGLASTIRITSVVDGSRCSLSVRDNGPGVPAAIQARLGERFFRNRETSVEGNGLGLAIVARIAELHGGSLAAGNLPEGGFAATLDRLHLATAIS
ncbi:MAG: two-component sensor histidine kinase [Betaproteobacteria bacterium HGW-Betaproteobacteria-7]|nr:MAG: two-component sensor histidine kinase [Betaproteobacteria bacterium HGW-Betaproteobacteria-7]